MFFERFLLPIHADDTGRSVKIVNENLLSPLVYSSKLDMVELEPEQMVNVPIFETSDIAPDKLFFGLLASAKRATTFDVLHSKAENFVGFFNKALEDYDEHIKPGKIAVVGAYSPEIQQALFELTQKMNYVEIFTVPFLGRFTFILPLEYKIGAWILQGKNKKKMGMMIYEEYVKKLISYTDDDLLKVVDKLTTAHDQGEL